MLGRQRARCLATCPRGRSPRPAYPLGSVQCHQRMHLVEPPRGERRIGPGGRVVRRGRERIVVAALLHQLLHHLFGVELESKGTSANTDAKVTDTDGITPQQVESFTRLACALCELMDVDEKSILRHADWTDGGPKFGGPWLPTRGRKNDTLVPTEFWRKAVKRRRLTARLKALVGR